MKKVSTHKTIRKQRLVHWRFTIYQRLLGHSGLLIYRQWAWSKSKAHRLLAEQTRERQRSQKRMRELRVLHYLEGLFYGHDIREFRQMGQL